MRPSVVRPASRLLVGGQLAPFRPTRLFGSSGGPIGGNRKGEQKEFLHLNPLPASDSEPAGPAFFALLCATFVRRLAGSRRRESAARIESNRASGYKWLLGARSTAAADPRSKSRASKSSAARSPFWVARANPKWTRARAQVAESGALLPRNHMTQQMGASEKQEGK